MPTIHSPKILVPLTITAAMVTACSIAEPSASETAWVSAGTYVVGDRRIRTTTHREYECVLGHTGITTLPENDPNRWQDIGPTDKWAMFDSSCSTQSLATTSLSFTLQPGFFNAIALYKVIGSTLTVVVKDAPGGTVIHTETVSLVGPFVDEYDFYWGPHRENGKAVIDGLMPYPQMEVTVTVTAGAGNTVGIGMVAIGDLRDLILGDWGGAQQGAKAEPVDYSLIKTNEFGDTTIVKRHNATDVRVSLVLPQADADYALSCIQEVLSVPVAFIATTAEGYAGLNVFGLVTGPMSYDSSAHATFDINVKGLI